uniref:PPM-type phosphatase domain-containing protein n=1 Tax=Brugia timori TaxID=42155 RepID=A0A0R3QG10_9BILA
LVGSCSPDRFRRITEDRREGKAKVGGKDDTRADATLLVIVAGKVWEWLCDNVAGTAPKDESECEA